MIWSLLVFILLQYCVESRHVNQDSLIIEDLNEEYLKGVYITGQLGIKFTAAQLSLSIKTLSNETLVSSVLRVSSNDQEITSVVIGNKGFIRMNGVDSVIPVNLANQLMKMSSIEHLNQLVLPQHDFEREMREAIGHVLQQVEYHLLEQVVLALGRREGIQGNKHPCVMPFFKFVLQLKKVEHYFHNVSYTNQRGKLKDDDDECLEYCPPCPEEECIGLCGYGCNCWKFLCGDCCYHVGCYDHDVCCRENFFAIKCLFPWNFQCEEHYYCKNH